MSDFNDGFDRDEMAEAREDARRDAREEADRDEARGERFGIGVCRTGVCVEPCGDDGGCAR